MFDARLLLALPLAASLLWADSTWLALHDHVQARAYSRPPDGPEWGELYEHGGDDEY